MLIYTQNTAPPPRRRLRFSLLSLFVLTTLVCLALSWWAWPRPVLVSTLLHVGAVPAIGPDGTSKSFAVLKRDVLELLSSDEVFRATVRDPKIARLSLIRFRPDPVKWLQREARVEFPGDVEILSISLSVRSQQSSQAATLLNALVDTLIRIADFTEQQTRKEMIAAARTEYVHLQERADRTASVLEKLQKEVGEDDRAVELLKYEVHRFARQAADMLDEVERLETGKSAAAGINRIQEAVVTSRPGK